MNERIFPHGKPNPDSGNAEAPAEAEAIEQLIRLADTGPEIPADGIDRVKAATRPFWQEQVRSRNRRVTVLALAGSLAAAAVAIVAINLGPLSRQNLSPETAVARIAVVTGTVEILGPIGSHHGEIAAEEGASIFAGTWLRTPPDGRLALDLAEGQSVRLDTDTRVYFEGPGTLTLDRGAVYVDSNGVAGDGVEVRTSYGIARDIGTQFEVRIGEESLTVRVREGSVELTRKEDVFEISNGTALTVATDGPPKTASTSAHGPEWDWVQTVAPPFVIEGRSVAEFLGWVSRETGRRVRFADAETEQVANATVLHGSLEGLTPREAPAVVLPSSGLFSLETEESITVQHLRPTD